VCFVLYLAFVIPVQKVYTRNIVSFVRSSVHYRHLLAADRPCSSSSTPSYNMSTTRGKWCAQIRLG
jgi:hypothetical protein